MDSLVKNAADEGQVRAAGKKEKNAAERLTNDVYSVLASAQGRSVLWHLMGHCKTFGSVFDPGRTEYNAGKQDVGHYILKLVEDARPGALIQMMQEEKNG